MMTPEGAAATRKRALGGLALLVEERVEVACGHGAGLAVLSLARPKTGSFGTLLTTSERESGFVPA